MGKWDKMIVRSHFEFRIQVERIEGEECDMYVCKPDGTILKENRKDSLITSKDSTIFAERVNLDEKTGLKARIIPMDIKEARLYVERFNNKRKEKGWEPVVFSVLT